MKETDTVTGAMNDEGAARKGRNEAWFRELNERLELQAANHRDTRSFEAVCECDREECTTRISISFVEYERVRADARAFVVRPGHVDPSVERVVWSNDEFDVVAKIGTATLVAELVDPRDERRAG